MTPLSPLRAAIISAGLVSNEYFLDLNQAIEDPAPRFPRSRMFKWPISISRHEDRLTICSHLMAFEPFVMRVAALLKTPCDIETDPPGSLNTVWHHAVDLANDDGFRDLIKTVAYTTPRAVMRGVTINVLAARLSTKHARAVLAAVEVEEPDDRSARALSASARILHPAFIDNSAGTSKPRAGKGKWAVNLFSRRDPVGEAWAAVHGVEDGWFTKTKHGYTEMSVAGMSQHMGVLMP